MSSDDVCQHGELAARRLHWQSWVIDDVTSLSSQGHQACPTARRGVQYSTPSPLLTASRYLGGDEVDEKSLDTSNASTISQLFHFSDSSSCSRFWAGYAR